MLKVSNTIEVNGIVEHAEYRECSTSGSMLVVTLVVHLSKNSDQKVWDNMIIEHENLLAVRIGRVKAKELAIACGLKKRPQEDNVSALVGHEVQLRLTIDDEGNFRVLKYMPAIIDNNPNSVANELPF